VEVNDFLDWDQEQLDNFFSFRAPEESLASSPPLRSSLLGASPSALDWRTLNRVTDVKNQLSCGSCWSFAATAQYESLLSIERNGLLYDLSEQFALEC